VAWLISGRGLLSRRPEYCSVTSVEIDKDLQGMDLHRLYRGPGGVLIQLYGIWDGCRPENPSVLGWQVIEIRLHNKAVENF
jgi:hypothetical protein